MDAALLAASMLDPVLFFECVLLSKLRKWQRDLLNKIILRQLRGERHLRIHIRTCHTAGKTFLVAGLTLWWMLRPLARAVTTAPTARSVNKLLWPEMRRLYHGSLLRKWKWGQIMDSAEYRVDHKRAWFALGMSSDDPFNLEGQHSPTAAMLVFDEAKAIDNAIRNGLQGFLHAPESLLIAISTPWLEDGWYYDMDMNGGDDVIRVVVTIDDLIAEGVPASQEAKDDYLQLYGGEESPEFQSRAMARYISSNPFGDIRSASFDGCVARAPKWEGLRVASLDVARGEEGDESHDESCIALAQGVDVIKLLPFRTADLVKCARRLVVEAKKFDADILRPDANGIGAGPSDILKSEGWPEDGVDEFVAQSAAWEPDRFTDRMTEAAWDFAQRVNRIECSLPDDKTFRKQALQIRFNPVKGGKIQLDKRPKVHGVRPRSPDRLDAGIMATARGSSKPGQGLKSLLNRMRSE